MHQEQYRKRYGVNQARVKPSNSTNALISVKDTKRVGLSREKQSQYRQFDRQKNRNREPKDDTLQYVPQQHTPCLPHDYSSRMGHTYQALPSNHQKTPKNKPVKDTQQTISINVNIQNLLQPKSKETLPAERTHTERSLSNKNHSTYSSDPKKQILKVKEKQILKPKQKQVNKIREKDIYKAKEKEPLNKGKEKFKQKDNKPKQKGTFECDEQLECLQVLKVRRNCSEILVQKTQKIERKNTTVEYTTLKQKQKQVDPKQEIKKFEKQMQTINSTGDYQALIYLDNLQQQYTIPANYIERGQKKFSWAMRAQLMEWMMQVCYEYSLKRETFHIAVSLVDGFMCREPHLAVSQFQLIGVAAMFMASKLEEFEPKTSEEFSKTTNNKYLAKTIKQTEKKMSKTLMYRLNPPTLHRWSNRLLLQWDTYIAQSPYASSHPVFATTDIIYFKNCDERSYMLWRQMMQFMDCAVMDVETLRYQGKLVVCAFLYLVLGREMGFFHNKQIVSEFPYSSLYLLDETNPLNDLYNNFLESTFSITLIDLLPTIQYSATYFLLPMVFDKPILPNDQQAEDTMQLEQYCSFQTYNRHCLPTIKKRQRGIYS